ncbi:hypothetical protein [Kroppenstedtia guangzhouensis]|nr:hypothetical protein [Kroppenstedtia guangzhouensis]
MTAVPEATVAGTAVAEVVMGAGVIKRRDGVRCDEETGNMVGNLFS